MAAKGPARSCSWCSGPAFTPYLACSSSELTCAHPKQLTLRYTVTTQRGLLALRKDACELAAREESLPPAQVVLTHDINGNLSIIVVCE